MYNSVGRKVTSTYLKVSKCALPHFLLPRPCHHAIEALIFGHRMLLCSCGQSKNFSSHPAVVRVGRFTFSCLISQIF